MPRRNLKHHALFATALLIAMLFAGMSRAETRPHIVLVMADDLGYGDPGCYNPDSKIPTPNIDRLAAQGMRFTDAHAPAAYCIPTRYGLLSGRFPMRMHRDGDRPVLEPDRVTLASLLRERGYRTHCVGKWHLGIDVEEDYARLRGGPVDRGFDSYFGIYASLDIPPYYEIENDHAVRAPTETIAENHSPDVSPVQGAFWREGKIAPGFVHAELLPKLTERAVSVVDEHAANHAEEPLFLYFPLTGPHTPWLPTEPFRGRTSIGDYGDFAVQVDDALGQVLAALDRHGMSDKTLVIFSSDNGPMWLPADVERHSHRSAGPWRGMKADAWEAGHRVPFIVRWPGNVAEGVVSDALHCHTDALATTAAILGATLPENAGEDSHNMLPVLRGEAESVRDTLVSFTGRGTNAIRQGDWKLIPALGSCGFSEPRRIVPEPGGPQGQLYNLAEDPSESNNLWLEHPEIVERLTALLEQYQSSGRSVD